MKKHELDAAITAAEEELARLRAMTPEPELHPMTLPLERCSSYGHIASTGEVQMIEDTAKIWDNAAWTTANYYASTEQAARYADAFEVMRLMRRKPGIVGANAVGSKYRPTVEAGELRIQRLTYVAASYCMFPCFESQQAASAAVAAVGADRLVRCANWLAGVVE